MISWHMMVDQVLTRHSGPALRHLHPGASTPAVEVAVAAVSVLHAVAAALLLHVDPTETTATTSTAAVRHARTAVAPGPLMSAVSAMVAVTVAIGT